MSELTNLATNTTTDVLGDNYVSQVANAGISGGTSSIISKSTNIASVGILAGITAANPVLGGIASIGYGLKSAITGAVSNAASANADQAVSDYMNGSKDACNYLAYMLSKYSGLELHSDALDTLWNSTFSDKSFIGNMQVYASYTVRFPNRDIGSIDDTKIKYAIDVYISARYPAFVMPHSAEVQAVIDKNTTLQKTILTTQASYIAAARADFAKMISQNMDSNAAITYYKGKYQGTNGLTLGQIYIIVADYIKAKNAYITAQNSVSENTAQVLIDSTDTTTPLLYAGLGLFSILLLA
jgi:hypothetical protein